MVHQTQTDHLKQQFKTKQDANDPIKIKQHCFFMWQSSRFCKNIKLTLNEKNRIDNSRTECVKVTKYIYWVKKKTCWGVLDTGYRDKNNETGLKEGRGIKIETTVLPFAMLAPSLCIYLPS